MNRMVCLKAVLNLGLCAVASSSASVGASLRGSLPAANSTLQWIWLNASDAGTADTTQPDDSSAHRLLASPHCNVQARIKFQADVNVDQTSFGVNKPCQRLGSGCFVANIGNTDADLQKVADVYYGINDPGSYNSGKDWRALVRLVGYIMGGGHGYTLSYTYKRTETPFNDCSDFFFVRDKFEIRLSLGHGWQVGVRLSDKIVSAEASPHTFNNGDMTECALFLTTANARPYVERTYLQQLGQATTQTAYSKLELSQYKISNKYMVYSQGYTSGSAVPSQISWDNARVCVGK